MEISDQEGFGKNIVSGKGRRLVIPDIHGCLKTLDALLNTLALTHEDQLFFLGDFIDRGPDSSGVIDRIIDLTANNYQIFPLRGNHEEMLLQIARFDRAQLHEHARYYRIEDLLKDNVVIEKYLDFFNALPFYYELDGFILVHAGLNMEIANPMEDFEAMLWIRNFPVDQDKLGSRHIVHGHNPTDLNTIQHQIKERHSVIPLDNGCVLGDQIVGMGNLLCLNLDNWQLTVQKNVEF